MKSRKIKFIIILLSISLILCITLYIKNSTFYDLRPLFFKNRMLYESMIDFINENGYIRENQLNTEYTKEFYFIERQLGKKAKIIYVNMPLENVKDIHFYRNNQTIIYSRRPEEEIRQNISFYEKLDEFWYYSYSSGGETNVYPPPPYKQP